MTHLLHILFGFLAMLPLVGMIEGEAAPGDGGGAASEPEPASSYDRAMEYTKEHPIFGPEPDKPAESGEPKPAEPKPAEPKPAEPKPGEQPAEAPKPGEPPAAPKPGEPPATPGYDPTKPLEAKSPKDFEQLPYFKDATFQKLFKEHETLSMQVHALTDVFRGEWRENGQKYAVSNADQLRGVLEDAYSLYDIGNLNTPVSEFMAIFEKNFPEQNVRAVLASLASYIEGKGIKGTEAADLNNPIAVRLTKIEADRNAERQTREREQSETAKKEAFEGLEKHVGAFLKDNDADVADALDYLTIIVSQIGGKPDQLKAIRDGKFAEVDRILTNYHNSQVERQKRWMDTKIKEAEGREGKLKKQPLPASGSTPEPAAPPPRPKVNLADGESRRAEALRQFRG
jgi:hypothetical protein